MITHTPPKIHVSTECCLIAFLHMYTIHRTHSTYLHVEAETLVDGEGMAEDGVSHRLLQSAMPQHDEGDGGHEHRDDG